MALVASAVLAPAARADVLVAYDHVVPGQGFDVAVRDLQQDGSPVTLPPGINTAANEFHPTLSGDGRLLAFERDTLANTPGPERPPIYNKQLVVVDLHAGRIVTPPPFQFSDALRQTPSISSDGRWVINGNFPFSAQQSSFATITDLSNSAPAQLSDVPPPPPAAPPATCPLEFICTPAGNSGAEVSIPPSAAPDTSVGSTTGIFNPSAGAGATPLLAWSRYPVTRYPDGSAVSDIALRVRRYAPGFAGAPTLDLTVPHAPNQVFGHPAVIGTGLVAFEAIPNGGAGNGDIYSVDASGHVSTSLPAINSLADERQPAWTRDGRYLAVLRHGADGHERILLFDFANNLLVDPAGLDIGATPPADSHPLGESRALQGGISIADDPTARTSTAFLLQPNIQCTALKGATVSCRVVGSTVVTQKTTTVGIILRRVLGFQLVLGRDSKRLSAPIRMPLGRLHGRTRLSKRVPRHLLPGRYELTVRTFGVGGRVQTLSKPVNLTVPCFKECAT